MFKRVNVVMLPTNKKASIFIDTIEPGVLIFDKNYLESNIHWKDVPHYHLYITSDDKIEEDDWFISKDNIYEVNTIENKLIYGYTKDKNEEELELVDCKKIIATTDISIKIKAERAGDNAWYNPYPRPSDVFISKFIEEYNKGNIITDVMVEYEQKRVYGDELDIHGHNKEVVKVNSKDNTITIKKVKDSWSREEVINLLKKAKCDFPYHRGIQVLDNMLDNWIKENL